MHLARLSTPQKPDDNETTLRSKKLFRKWFGHKPAPLTGAPTVRRQKTYSAQSGYVYQYYYAGQRASDAEPATEFVFDVSADRKTSNPISVLVLNEAVDAWQRQHGRELTSAERY